MRPISATLSGAALVVAGLAGQRHASAQETPATPPVTVTAAPENHWYDGLSINGFASIGYEFNTNRPADDTNQMRVFDTDDNNFNVDVIEMVLQKPVTKPGEAGFRFDLTAGSTVPQVTASAGLFRSDSGGEDFDLQQAYVSYIAEVGRGLRLDAGKFITSMGYEVIEGYDGYNDNYTRSFLFGYAIPFTHTGVKVSYPFSDAVSAMVMVTNGWDDVKDNNSGKTFCLNLGLTPVPGLAVYLNYIGGPEQPDNDTDWRQVGDLVATYKPVDFVTIGVNGDYGIESDVPVGDGTMMVDAAWMGTAAYGVVNLTGQFALALRGEWFRDRDGVRTGIPQNLVEATLTPTLKLTDSFLLRGDLRVDHSNKDAFEGDEAMSQRQVTVALNAIGIL
jgi:hypothetical protein